MNSKTDRSCELLAFIVLFILSALSRFWFIMIAISVGLTIGIAGAMLSRTFLYLMTQQFPKPARRYEFQKDGLSAKTLLGILSPRRLARSAIALLGSEE
jgi:hypothetical protein